MNRIAIVLMFIVFVSSCKSKDKEVNKEGCSVISGRITDVVVDHVIEYRDWCRFSNIIYYIEVHNTCSDTVKLMINKPDDDCATELDYPNLWYCNKDTSIVLGALNILDSVLILDPQEVDTIRVKIMERINGASIKEILVRFDHFISVDFYIKSKGLLNMDTILFEKAPDFKIGYMLDNQFILKDDSVSINKRRLIPPIVDK